MNKLKTQLLRHKQGTLSTFFDILKNCFRKRQYNDIYQETVVKQVGMVYFDVLTSLASINALCPLGRIVIFSLIFAPQVTKFGLRVSTNKRIKVKKYEAKILQKARFISM